MANIKASKKDIRRSGRRREQNAQMRARLRTMDKKIRKLVQDNNAADAGSALKEYSAYLDRAGSHSLIHKKQADRRKSRMAQLINKSAAG